MPVNVFSAAADAAALTAYYTLFAFTILTMVGSALFVIGKLTKAKNKLFQAKAQVEEGAARFGKVANDFEQFAERSLPKADRILETADQFAQTAATLPADLRRQAQSIGENARTMIIYGSAAGAAYKLWRAIRDSDEKIETVVREAKTDHSTKAKRIDHIKKDYMMQRNSIMTVAFATAGAFGGQAVRDIMAAITYISQCQALSSNFGQFSDGLFSCLTGFTGVESEVLVSQDAEDILRKYENEVTKYSTGAALDAVTRQAGPDDSDDDDCPACDVHPSKMCRDHCRTCGALGSGACPIHGPRPRYEEAREFFELQESRQRNVGAGIDPPRQGLGLDRDANESRAFWRRGEKSVRRAVHGVFETISAGALVVQSTARRGADFMWRQMVAQMIDLVSIPYDFFAVALDPIIMFCCYFLGFVTLPEDIKAWLYIQWCAVKRFFFGSDVRRRTTNLAALAAIAGGAYYIHGKYRRRQRSPSRDVVHEETLCPAPASSDAVQQEKLQLIGAKSQIVTEHTEEKEYQDDKTDASVFSTTSTIKIVDAYPSLDGAAPTAAEIQAILSENKKLKSDLDAVISEGKKRKDKQKAKKAAAREFQAQDTFQKLLKAYKKAFGFEPKEWDDPSFSKEKLKYLEELYAENEWEDAMDDQRPEDTYLEAKSDVASPSVTSATNAEAPKAPKPPVPPKKKSNKNKEPVKQESMKLDSALMANPSLVLVHTELTDGTKLVVTGFPVAGKLMVPYHAVARAVKIVASAPDGKKKRVWTIQPRCIPSSHHHDFVYFPLPTGIGVDPIKSNPWHTTNWNAGPAKNGEISVFHFSHPDTGAPTCTVGHSYIGASFPHNGRDLPVVMYTGSSMFGTCGGVVKSSVLGANVGFWGLGGSNTGSNNYYYPLTDAWAQEIGGPMPAANAPQWVNCNALVPHSSVDIKVSVGLAKVARDHAEVAHSESAERLKALGGRS